MSVSVTLPKMGESVMEGTIIKWLKKEGEQVQEDEPIVEISTDKIDTELPSPAAGILSKIVVGPDQTVDVGTEIAIIDESGSATDAAPAQEKEKAEGEAETPEKDEEKDEDKEPKSAKSEAQEKQPLEPEQGPPAAAQSQPAREPAAPKGAAPSERPAPSRSAPTGDNGSREQAFSSPLARKLARERGVDAAAITGTGRGGRITKEDVLAATERPARPKAQAQPVSQYAVPSDASTDVSFDRVRKAIADHMTRSLSTAAQLTTVIEVDLTRVVGIRQRAKAAFEQAEGFNLTYMPFIAAATVQTLRSLPEFNAHILDDGQTARLYHEVNLGIAVGRDEGLIVPVIHGADGMNLIGLARAIADVGGRARAKGQLKPDDVTGGTFTLTNYGSYGGIIDTPIINQPQVAILGIGAIVKRPAVISVDGADAIAIRHIGFFSLTYDHRWIDGHKAAQFNGRLREILEQADFEKELGL